MGKPRKLSWAKEGKRSDDLKMSKACLCDTVVQMWEFCWKIMASLNFTLLLKNMGQVHFP